MLSKINTVGHKILTAREDCNAILEAIPIPVKTLFYKIGNFVKETLAKLTTPSWSTATHSLHETVLCQQHPPPQRSKLTSYIT